MKLCIKIADWAIYSWVYFHQNMFAFAQKSVFWKIPNSSTRSSFTHFPLFMTWWHFLSRIGYDLWIRMYQTSVTNDACQTLARDRQFFYRIPHSCTSIASELCRRQAAGRLATDSGMLLGRMTLMLSCIYFNFDAEELSGFCTGSGCLSDCLPYSWAA